MQTIKTDSCEVHLAEHISELTDFFDSLPEGSLLTYDWETTGLEYNSVPLLLSLHHDGPPLTVPIHYCFTRGLSMREVASVLNERLTRYRLIAHNAKFDRMISVMNGILPECVEFYADTIAMVHLVDPSLNMHLEDRVKDDFGYAKKMFEEICGKKWNKINWVLEGDSLLELLAGYAGEDTFWETKLYHKYKDLMDDDAKRIHDKIEIPLVDILCAAKIRGVRIDASVLHGMKKVADKKVIECMENIYDIAGCVFNIASVKQKRAVFFDKLKLPVMFYSGKSNEPSTNAETAEAWADMGFPIGKELVKYSEIQKLLSGYINPIPNMLDSEGVLRGDMNSCGTRTGRMSSSNPNLQNQPNNHDFPIRSAFVPRDGYVFVNYDYSQLELRVMAHMSKDEKFLDIFLHGRDPHGEVARDCGISRRDAKIMNFGVLYGMGPKKFAAKFGCSVNEARRRVDNYHTTYSGFARWKTRVEDFAKRNGYVKNLFGRKRLFPVLSSGIPSQSNSDAYFGELRQSVNTIIQGTGADIVKLATIEAVRRLADAKLDAHFLIQVHDELLFEVREDHMLEAERIIISSMQDIVKLDVPLIVDGKILRNWGEMKDDDVLSVPFRFDYSLMSSIL